MIWGQKLLRNCSRTEEKEQQDELKAIILEVQALSARVHAQNVRVDCGFLEGVSKQASPLFDSTSGNVLPHRALKLHNHCDDDELLSTELDGEEIDLVIDPLIQGCVVKTGQILNVPKTWKAAVVWVVRSADLRAENVPSPETVTKQVKGKKDPSKTSTAGAESKNRPETGSGAAEEASSCPDSPEQRSDYAVKKPASPLNPCPNVSLPADVVSCKNEPEAPKNDPPFPLSMSSLKSKDNTATSKPDSKSKNPSAKRKHDFNAENAAEASLPVSKKPNVKKVLNPESTRSTRVGEDEKKKATQATFKAQIASKV